MRKFLLILLALVVVLIGAALIVPFLVPTDTYKQRIAREVESATGRRLTIEGPLDFTILPHLAFEAEDVALANPPGAVSPDMVRLEALQLQLRIWPLLNGTIEVDRFILIEPRIDLEIDAQGNPNWELFGAQPADGQVPAPDQAEEQPQAEAEPAPGGGAGAPADGLVSDIKLGDIRIEDGAVTYRDARTGTTAQVEAINMTVSLPDLASPLQAEGSLAYKGETIGLRLSAEQPSMLLEGGTSPVALAIETDPAQVSFDGQIDAGASSSAGTLDVQVGSIRDLAAWLAEPIAFEGEGLQTLAISGQLAAGPQRVALTDLSLGLDAIEARGELATDLSGAVPKVSGRLDVGAVDLDPYLPPPGEQAEPEPEGQAGDAGPDGWSDEPIELPPLGGAEVDFALNLDSLTVREIEIGKTAAELKVAGGSLSAVLNEMALYGGQATGQLDVSASEGVPVIRPQFRLDGLQALPFLTAVADFDRLEGDVNAQLEVESRGGSELQLVRNLNGEGAVTFTDGAIVGINIAAMVRNVASAFLNPEAGEQRKTDFGELSGTFTIRDGIVTNDDMRLQAPVLRVSGRGRVDLPARTLTYVLEPKAAATLEGQGGAEQVAGVLVPVVIEGPWDDLSYRPDLSGVLESALESPEALKEQAEGAKKVLEDAVKGDPGALIEGVTGGSGGQGESAGAAGDAAKKLLKGLFDN